MTCFIIYSAIAMILLYAIILQLPFSRDDAMSPEACLPLPAATDFSSPLLLSFASFFVDARLSSLR
jgi:hypothetical protein